MQNLPAQAVVPADEEACICVDALARRESSLLEPYQLSFLSPLPDATAGERKNTREDDPEYVDSMRRLRRRRSRCLTKADVEKANSADDQRAPLRTSTGEFLPALYVRDETTEGVVLKPADAATITQSADALLAYRFRAGVKILRDPYLLLRFLRIRLVSQDQPVFAAFFLDRRQRLIQFTELARGTQGWVPIHPREVVREALACGAELVLCVRSDPIGDHEPTKMDVEDAGRVKHAIEVLLGIPLLDYVIVGKGITSLRQRGVV